MVEPEIIELIKRLESPYNENSRIGERDQDLKDAVLYLLYQEQTRQMLYYTQVGDKTKTDR
jgi:hypothetical protein